MRPALPVKSRLLRYLSFGLGNGGRGGSWTCTGCALDAVPLLLGYATYLEMAPVVGLAPTRTDLKGRLLDSLHSRAIENGGTQPSGGGSRETDCAIAQPEGRVSREANSSKGMLPIPQVRDDLLSKESRRAGPVHVPLGARRWNAVRGSASSIAGRSLHGGGGRNCTCTGRCLGSVSLLLDYAGVMVLLVGLTLRRHAECAPRYAEALSRTAFAPTLDRV